MMGLVARYGDEWNWWSYDETLDQLRARFEPILETLGLALEEEGRDPDSLPRTIDVYSFVAPGMEAEHDMRHHVSASTDEIVEVIGALGGLGFDEVRWDLYPKTTAAVEAMAPVLSQLH